MKKFIASAMLAAAVATPAASAADLEMSQLTCAQLFQGKAEDIGVILFWIDGYVSHKTGNTGINFEGVKADGEKIGTYCAANPDAKVLEYVEAATGGN